MAVHYGMMACFIVTLIYW